MSKLALCVNLSSATSKIGTVVLNAHLLVGCCSPNRVEEGSSLLCSSLEELVKGDVGRTCPPKHFLAQWRAAGKVVPNLYRPWFTRVNLECSSPFLSPSQLLLCLSSPRSLSLHTLTIVCSVRVLERKKAKPPTNPQTPHPRAHSPRPRALSSSSPPPPFKTKRKRN